MQKKGSLILIASGVVLILVGVGTYLFSHRGQDKIESPSGNSPEVSVPTISSSVLTWKDPAGFTFNYPEGLKMDNHPEDKVNYANVDITVSSSSSSGKINILASDTKYKTIVDWATKDKSNALVSGGGTETTLGGKAARKLNFTETKEVIIGTIDQGILFTVKVVPGADGKIVKVFDQIVSSFQFYYPTPASSGASSTSGGGDIIEEEEIVQ